MFNRESRQTAKVAWCHHRRRLTSNPTQPPRPLSRSSPVANLFMQPIWCTLSKAHSHASPRCQPFQVGRRYDLSEASLQVLPPILDLHIKFFPYDAACQLQITYLRLTSLFSSRRSSALWPVLSRRMRQVAVKVHACSAAATLATKADGVAIESESSLISLTVVSSNSKGGPVMVSTYVTCCGTASSVTFNIRHDTLFNEQEGGFK